MTLPSMPGFRAFNVLPNAKRIRGGIVARRLAANDAIEGVTARTLAADESDAPLVAAKGDDDLMNQKQ